MKPLLTLAALLAAAVSLSAADTSELLRAAAMPAASWRELARTPPGPQLARSAHEEREKPRRLRPYDLNESAISAKTVTASFAPPAATVGFRPMYDILFAYPSDASGAVGPNQILSVSNSEYTVHDRSGNRISSLTIQQFWSDPTVSGGSYFDSHAAYDARNGRWIIVSLYDVSFKRGQLLIAVSQTGDAAGVWSRYRFNVHPTDTNQDPDFDRIALTRDALVVTAAIYSGDSFLGPTIYVVQLSDLYAVPASLPITSFGTHFSISDPVPVTSYEDDGAIYLAAAESDVLYLYSVTGSTFRQIGAVRSAYHLEYTGISLVGPQFGTNTRVDCGLPLLHNVVLRGKTFYAAESGYETSPLRAAVRWWKFNPSLAVAQSGLVEHPTGGASYAFPSIAVNASGAALVGYSVFAPDRFPSAGYTSIDAAGHASTPALLKEGDAPYFIDRWADFSTTVVDPVNDSDFWTVQTYSLSLPPSSIIRWAMWWGKIPAPPSGRARVARK